MDRSAVQRFGGGLGKSRGAADGSNRRKRSPPPNPLELCESGLAGVHVPAAPESGANLQAIGSCEGPRGHMRSHACARRSQIDR